MVLRARHLHVHVFRRRNFLGAVELRGLGFEGTRAGVGPIIEKFSFALRFRIPAALGADQVARLLVLSIYGLVLVLWALIQLLRCQLTFLCREVTLNIIRLHLWKIKLLRPQNAAGPGDPDPANERLGWYLKVLHGPEANEGACAA